MELVIDTVGRRNSLMKATGNKKLIISVAVLLIEGINTILFPGFTICSQDTTILSGEDL